LTKKPHTRGACIDAQKPEKRHVLVDTIRACCFTLLSILPTFKVEMEPFSSWRPSSGCFAFCKKLFAAGGYQGPDFTTALAKVRPHLNVEIVKRSDRAKGFVVLSKRWIVERTLAWLNRCRRLAKDWESRNRKALAFLHLASIRLMLRKLCNPA
jgi:transposase